MSKSYLERITDILIREADLPLPIKEYRFCDERRWKFDYVWMITETPTPYFQKKPGVAPVKGVVLEVEGGVFMKKARHTSGKGFTADCEKYNEASLRGYVVLRVTKEHLISGKAMEWVKRALPS